MRGLLRHPVSKACEKPSTDVARCQCAGHKGAVFSLYISITLEAQEPYPGYNQSHTSLRTGLLLGE